MQKMRIIGVAVIIFLLLPVFSAFVSAQQAPTADIIEPLKSIFTPILRLFTDAGSLSPTDRVGFMRFVLWIAVFAIIYGALRAAGETLVKGNIAMALAFVFATISAIFLPKELVDQVGAAWGQMAFLVLLAPIFLGIGYFAVKKFWDQPVLSLAAWFMLFYLIAYFNVVYTIQAPPGNYVDMPGFGRVAGVLTVVFRVLSTIAAVAIIIQLIRSLQGLGSGSAAPAGGGWLSSLMGGAPSSSARAHPSHHAGAGGDRVHPGGGGGAHGHADGESDEEEKEEEKEEKDDEEEIERHIEEDIADMRKLLNELYPAKERVATEVEAKLSRDARGYSLDELRHHADAIHRANIAIAPVVKRFAEEVEETEELEEHLITKIMHHHHSLPPRVSVAASPAFKRFIRQFVQHIRNLNDIIGQQEPVIAAIKRGENLDKNRQVFLHQLLGETRIFQQVKFEAERFKRELQVELDHTGTAHRAHLASPLARGVIELTHADHRFDIFYEKLRDNFEENEREEKGAMAEYLASRYTADGVEAHSHCIAFEYQDAEGKIDYAGGILFDWIRTDKHLDSHGRAVPPAYSERFAFGITWWMFADQKLPKDFRERVNADLLNYQYALLQRTSGISNHHLKGIFAEINDPDKMHLAHIASDKVNPLRRISWWTHQGYRPVFYDYKQFMYFDEERFAEHLADVKQHPEHYAKPDQEKQKLALEKYLIETERKFVSYLHLFCKPLDETWRNKGIRKEEFLMVLWGLIGVSNSWPAHLLPHVKHYREMEDAIAKLEALYASSGGTGEYHLGAPTDHTGRTHSDHDLYVRSLRRHDYGKLLDKTNSVRSDREAHYTPPHLR